jgi:hypothetical protein
MLRIKNRETILETENEDDDKTIGTEVEEVEENKEREDDDMHMSEDKEYIQEERRQ